MRTYSVFAPPVMPGTLEDDAQSLVFIRHGWSLAALFVPLIWMVVRRLWWVLLGYVVLCIAIQLASFAVPTWVTVGLSVALALIVMIEAGQLRWKAWRPRAIARSPSSKRRTKKRPSASSSARGSPSRLAHRQDQPHRRCKPPVGHSIDQPAQSRLLFPVFPANEQFHDRIDCHHRLWLGQFALGQQSL
jgi:hypothetical protein